MTGAAMRRPTTNIRRVFATMLTCAALAGCASLSGRPAFDLSGVVSARAPRASETGSGVAVVVRLPEASAPTSGDRVVVRAPDGAVAVLPDAQWADVLPNLVRSRLITALQNAGVAAAETGGAGLALAATLHRFEIDAAGDLATIEIAVQLIDNADGAVHATRIFRAGKPAIAHYGAPAIRALAAASDEAMARIAQWTRGCLQAGAQVSRYSADQRQRH